MDPNCLEKSSTSSNDGKKQTKKKSLKREDYLTWEDCFMGVALLVSMRSKDPNTQVGACIVNGDKIIVGTGYNGFPWGCSDDDFTWEKGDTEKSDNEEEKETKFLYVCHAEVNAVLNKNSESLKGCTIYVSLFPCNECAKIIIQSGIKTVVYMSDKNAHKIEVKSSKKMFDAADVKYRKFTPKANEIVVDFSKVLNK